MKKAKGNVLEKKKGNNGFGKNQGFKKVEDLGIESGESALSLTQKMGKCGFQATHLEKAIELIERMKKENCTIFLGFTANLMASGLRGILEEMCRKGFVDAIVTTAGSTDHDIIKSFMPYSIGSFQADDVELHKRGINRLGNIFVETKGFEVLEKKMQQWLKEFYSKEKVLAPSRLNKLVGEKLPKGSFLRACADKKIPVFCPGITDGAIGLQMHFFKQENKGFAVDVTKDMKGLASLVLGAEKTAAIILGGGISKHHIIGANILRDGLDYAVYVSTASEFDGSLSGAMAREAKSWGKIKELGKTVQLHCDATIAFPLIAAALAENGLL